MLGLDRLLTNPIGNADIVAMPALSLPTFQAAVLRGRITRLQKENDFWFSYGLCNS